MSGGLKSCGLKSGGLMSGGLKSYDRVLDGNNFRGRLFQALMLLGRNENLYASVLARRLVYDSVCRVRKARAGLTFSPLYRPVPPALDSPFYRPLAPALDSQSQRPQTASTTTGSPIAITPLPLNQSPTRKTMMLI